MTTSALASIRLISSDMQNILGTKCLTWAEAKEDVGGDDGGGSSMKSLSSSFWSSSASSKWPTYPVDIRVAVILFLCNVT